MKNLIIIIISILLVSCANVGQLTGGEKDEKNPIITKTNLKNTNFKDKSIIISFDEYIELNNPIENIKLFPNHSTLKFSVKYKSLIIKIDSNLRENTTYNLIIKEGIKDNHEGNLFNFEYIFSTGDNLDTGIVDLNFNHHLKKDHLFINIYSKNQDSFIINQYDYKKQIKENIVNFNGLKENKTYWYMVYEDNDKNAIPDKNAFYKIDTFTPNQKIKINNQILIDTSLNYKNYKSYTRIQKSALNHNYNGLNIKNILYKDKDSIIIGNIKNNEQQLLELLKQNIIINNNKKEYEYIIKNNSINYKIKEIKNNNRNEIYSVFKSNKKYDSLTFYFNNDSNLTFNLKLDENYYNQKFSEIVFKNDSFNNLFIIIYKQDKIIESFLTKNNEQNLFLKEGEYFIEIYDSNKIYNNLLFRPLYYKKIILKPNWIEEIIVKK